MSRILSRLNLAGLVVMTPDEALRVLIERSEWGTLATMLAAHPSIAGAAAGSAARFDSFGLTVADFPVAKSTGKPSIGGLAGALKQHGLTVKRTVDESYAVYVPHNREAVIRAAQRSKIIARAAAKAQAQALKQNANASAAALKQAKAKARADAARAFDSK